MVLMVKKQMVVLGRIAPRGTNTGDFVSKEIKIGDKTYTKIFERSSQLNPFRIILREIDKWRGYRNITAEIEGKVKLRGLNPDPTLSAIKNELNMIKSDGRMNQAGAVEIKLKDDAQSVENLRQIFPDKDVVETLIFKSQDSIAPGELKDLIREHADRDGFRRVEPDVRFIESMRSLPLDQPYTKAQANAVTKAINAIQKELKSSVALNAVEKDRIKRIFNEIEGRVKDNLVGKLAGEVRAEMGKILFPGKAEHFPVGLTAFETFVADVRQTNQPNFRSLEVVLIKLPKEWKNFSVEARQEMKPPLLRMVKNYLENEIVRSYCEDLPALNEEFMRTLKSVIENDQDI